MLKVVDLEHVRRMRTKERERTDRAAREATIALKRLVACVRRAPLRPEHAEILEAIWSDFYGARNGSEG